jgi:colicin import membrane protein/SWI/SNF-related matrix-associated actin-dependent regulator 1 of chromatin subfamily A
MWSCGAVFILSLVGQVTYHEMTVPPDTSMGRRAVVGFVTVLPVTGLALIAVLIHLRHADREETAAKALKRLDAERRAAEAAARAERQAAVERAEADERTHLRAELERVTGEHAAAAEAMEDWKAEAARVHQMTVSVLEDRERGAVAEAERLAVRAETLARKLEAATRKLAAGNGGSGSRKQSGTGSRKPAAVPAPAAAEGTPQTVPEAPPDLDAESAVLWYVDQGLSASAAGVAAGLSDSRGRQIVRKLTAPAPAGVDPVAGAGNGGSPAETGSGND